MKQRFRLFLKARSQFLLDILIFLLALVSSYIIRFEGIPGGGFFKQMMVLLPYLLVLRIVSFILLSVYSVAWRYISVREAFLIAVALLPVSLGLLFLRLFFPVQFILLRVPLSIIALEFLLSLSGTVGSRMIRRLVYEQSARDSFNNMGGSEKRNVILIGAGDAGNLMARELRRRPDLGLNVAGFIDDDPAKRWTAIQGFKVLGTTSELAEIASDHSIAEAIITIANASSRDIRRIKEACEKARIGVKIVPGLFELLNDEVKITKIRDINIDDLLGRSVIRFENHRREVTARYQDKRIMVTGAGGSIGSELCRQLATMKPGELVLVDKDEHSIYQVDSRMRRESPDIRTSAVIADVRDRARLAKAFEKHRPQVIFHAAAHKHVPLMELNAAEAISNNVLGTKTTADLAASSGVENFIFISTDKAVNPTSVMGASKKISEIVVQELAAASETRFSCVRFGNVLGSRGSVVPLFREQISQGGPITITDPDVRRYFMSISEAVQLIIQAGTIGKQGEIFVLDMGEPIRIRDLARDLIMLSGFAEDDFEIKYIGLRPGEKLVEEILVDEEKARSTEFEKIFIAPPIEVDGPRFAGCLATLLKVTEDGDKASILRLLQDMDIGFRPSRTGA